MYEWLSLLWSIADWLPVLWVWSIGVLIIDRLYRHVDDRMYGVSFFCAWELRPLVLPITAIHVVTYLAVSHTAVDYFLEIALGVGNVVIWIVQPYIVDKDDRRGKKKPSKVLAKVKSLGHRLTVEPVHS